MAARLSRVANTFFGTDTCPVVVDTEGDIDGGVRNARVPAGRRETLTLMAKLAPGGRLGR